MRIAPSDVMRIVKFEGVWPDSRAFSAASSKLTAFSTNRLTNVLIATQSTDLKKFGHTAGSAALIHLDQSLTLMFSDQSRRFANPQR